VTVRLPRGAVITGLVTDPRGEPAAGIRVDAMQYRFSAASAGRRLRASATAVTDDRGVYRIFGLAPGDYAIAAPYPASGLVALSETRPPSAADVGRAIAEAQASAVSARPGIPVPVSSGPRPAAPVRYVAPAAVFYPGTTDAAHAGVVTVKAGQEADGVDFALAYVPTATVSGVVTGASPGLARTVSLTRVSEVGRDFARGVPLDAEGRFVFRRVPPGRYAITARAVPPRSASSAPAGIQAYAAAEITVDGDDVAVTMGLQPGIRISGTVAFEGDGTPFPNVGSLSVPMPSVQTASGMAIDLPPARVEPARTVGQVSRFAISGLMAGQFRLTADVPGVRAPVRGWWLKSLVVGGREVLDEPLQMHESVDDAVLTLSDRASELGGLVTDAQRRSAGDVHVVAFSTSPAAWFPYSRRIGASRTNAEGRYAIHNLPPGAYFVVASDDVEPGEWFDSAFLAALAPRAVRLHVQGDSQQELNLRSERR
jgi:protocatechuate 3,4-dioxygenase beta subunit